MRAASATLTMADMNRSAAQPVVPHPASEISLPRPRAASTRDGKHAFLAMTLAGALLGPLDLLVQRTLPYPFANLANSGAVWALGAFALGMYVRRPAWKAAVAGVVLLLVAVESYYLSAVIIQHDSTSTLWSTSTQVWLVLAVVVGALFGAAGASAHSSRRWIRAGAAALAGLAFLVEAVYTVRGSSSPLGFSDHVHQTAMIEAGLAVAVPLVILTLRRRRRPCTTRTINQPRQLRT